MSMGLCVCLCVRALKGKQLELSTPNLVLHGSHSACIDPEVKGQGHILIKFTAGVGLQVSVTDEVFLLKNFTASKVSRS